MTKGHSRGKPPVTKKRLYDMKDPLSGGLPGKKNTVSPDHLQSSAVCASLVNWG